jgi:hypothetical protein
VAPETTKGDNIGTEMKNETLKITYSETTLVASDILAACDKTQS